MAYTKTNWTNDAGEAVDAINLNKIEDGIFFAHQNYNIRDLYESNWNRNAYTDADKAIVDGVGTGITDLGDRVTLAESDIADLEVDVIAHEGDIVALESTVANQDITLTDHEDRIVDLEGVAPLFTPFYEYSMITPPVITTDVWTETNRITTGVLPVGVYQMIHTAISSYDQVTRSGYCRISVDGGTTWTEFNHELKDLTDIVVVTCARPIVLETEGILDIIVEQRCEQAGDTLTVKTTNLMLERKV